MKYKSSSLPVSPQYCFLFFFFLFFLRARLQGEGRWLCFLEVVCNFTCVRPVNEQYRCDFQSDNKIEF